MSDILKKIDSIEKLAKEAERLAKNLQGNPFSAFDQMAKDIRERKDNAIAMEFTKCIGELLKKNGVTPKITEYTRESVKEHSIEQLYGVSIDELDFSEHDKEFEDKIADLQQRIRELIKEKDEYKRKCNNFGFESQELKQRIAELESENEKLFDCLGGITGNTRDEIKNNIENSKKISKKTIKTHTFIVGKEIDGQTYVKLDDFMSVVNDLQAEIST